MRVPPMSNCGLFGVRKNTHSLKQNPRMIKPIEVDTVSFSSKSKYLRQYATLPEEIREKLTPQDGIDMFQSMEQIANGRVKGTKVAKGGATSVYENPWLDNYYIMISTDIDDKTRVIYTQTNMGNLIWEDQKDKRIQLLKKND